MKRLVFLVCLVLVFACAGDDDRPQPLSEAGEKLYTVRGVIKARDAGSNTVNLDHENIPGFMEAMVMDYSVRGAKVAELPADRSRIEAKLHVTDRAYWITDVKKIP